MEPSSPASGLMATSSQTAKVEEGSASACCAPSWRPISW